MVNTARPRAGFWWLPCFREARRARFQGNGWLPLEKRTVQYFSFYSSTYILYIYIHIMYVYIYIHISNLLYIYIYTILYICMCIHVSYTLIKQFYSPAPYHHIPDGPLVCLASVPFFVEGFGWRPHAGSLQKGDHTFGWLGDIYSLLTLLKDAERAHTVWQDAEQRGGVPTLLLLHVLNTSSQPRQLRDGGRDLIYHDTWSSRDDSREWQIVVKP